MAIKVTNENYADLLAQDKLLVLDFAATWCGPCKRIAPIIDELATEYEGQALVGKVDVDDNEELALQYGIRNVPTILFIKNGEVVDKVVGAASKADFTSKIQANL